MFVSLATRIRYVVPCVSVVVIVEKGLHPLSSHAIAAPQLFGWIESTVSPPEVCPAGVQVLMT